MKLYRVAMLLGFVVFGLTCPSVASAEQHQHGTAPTESGANAPMADERPPTPNSGGSTAVSGNNPSPSATQTSSHAPVVFTLRTGIAEGRMVFIGYGGEIDRQVNPTLMVHEGETVQINLINGEGAQHDVVIDQYAARSAIVTGKNASSTFSFVASKVGEFDYYCSIPGHRQAGMQGLLQVVPGNRAEMGATATDITRDPADLPPPIGSRQPQIVRVDLQTVELKGQLDDKASYTYWTFNGKVPGPFVRVRVGDTVEVHLKNPQESLMIHSVDFHGAIGPGGGAEFTQTDPGTEAVVTFKALQPGIFVYHCATPSVPTHISNGMYGLLLVEPEGGLPQVDREFYVMQGEIYTVQPFGTPGDQELDYEKLLAERPEYFLFNGSVGALTRTHPLYANVGDTVRVFFGVGGPNFSSSFHMIGTIFDHVYALGSATSPPLTGVQTVSVPPGGATIVDFKIHRGGRYTLVDHALSRLERGLVGFLNVEGPRDDAIMHKGPAK